VVVIEKNKPNALSPEAQAALDWQWLLHDPSGCRVVATILRWSQVDELGPLDSHAAMADHRGRRAIGQMIRATCQKHDPQAWLRLEADSLEAKIAAARMEAAARDDAAMRDPGI